MWSAVILAGSALNNLRCCCLQPLPFIGGSVNEEMRVALTTTEETPIATAEAEAAQRTAPPSGLSEQEKEEWLRRETELLESLDDKVRKRRVTTLDQAWYLLNCALFVAI